MAGSKSRPLPWLLIVLIMIVLAFWLGWMAVGYLAWHDKIGWGGEGVDKAGVFGDMFGSLNALVAGLAFAAVFWTGHLQREALDEQRKALLDQKKDLDEQRTEQKRTREIVERQLFEEKFFRQIEIFRGISSALEFEDEKKNTASGIHAVHSLANAARECIRGAAGQIRDKESFESAVTFRYEELFSSTIRSMLAPYFGAIYYTIQSVGGFSAASAVEKAEYVNIFRGLLSQDDLALVAAYAIAEPKMGMRSCAAKYGLLKHFPQELRSEMLVAILGASAFAGMSGRGLVKTRSP